MEQRLALVRLHLLRALEWWIGELYSMLPTAMRAKLERRRPDVLMTLYGQGEALVSRLDRAGGSPPVSNSLPVHEAARIAAEQALAQGGGVEIRLPFAAVYSRLLELPNVSPKELRRMADLDLVRTTPFRLDEVYTACDSLASGTNTSLKLRQIVVGRKIIDPVRDLVEQAGAKVEWVGCWDAAGRQPITVNLLPAEAVSGASKLTRLALGAAAVLCISAVALYQARHGEALAEVGAKLAAERTSAKAVQGALQASTSRLDLIGKLEQLRADRPSALLVMEHLARILPDTTYLQDLRVTGDTVEVTGLGKSASQLPQSLERSGSFTDAVLTAPITTDANSDRERFALRARFRLQTATPAAGSGTSE